MDRTDPELCRFFGTVGSGYDGKWVELCTCMKRLLLSANYFRIASSFRKWMDRHETGSWQEFKIVVVLVAGNTNLRQIGTILKLPLAIWPSTAILVSSPEPESLLMAFRFNTLET